MARPAQQKKLSGHGRKRSVRRKRVDYYDYSLLAVIILLTCFGLIMLYSTSSYMAEVKYGDDMYFFKKQALISAVCIVAAVVISKIDYHILGRFTTILYVSALFLMALVKITPLGQEVNGARRWLKLGIQFQPAEIAENCGDCMSALYDHKHGAAGKNAEGLYEIGRIRRTSCCRCLYFNRKPQYGYHYFRYYCRPYFYGSSKHKAVSQYCGGGCGSCGGNRNIFVSYGRPGNKRKLRMGESLYGSGRNPQTEWDIRLFRLCMP